MAEPVNPIYDFLKQNDLTTKDEATFLEEYSNEDKAKELYGFIKENKLTTKEFGDFYSSYFEKTPTFETGQLEEVNITARANPIGMNNVQQQPFNFAEQSNPALYQAVTKRDRDNEKRRSQELSKMNAVYDMAQGQGAVEALQTAAIQSDTPPVGELESIGNSFKNIATRLKGSIPRLNVVSADLWEKVLGKELAKKVYENDIQISMDGISFGRDINQIRNQAYSDLEQLGAQVKPTLGIVDAIERNDWGQLAAGAVDAMTSIASTAVPAVATGGAGLFTEMMGESLVDYNELKAKRLGISVPKLYETDQADFQVPAMIGAVGGAMELIGLSGVKNLLTKKITGSLYKKAAIYFAEANKEGLTEVIQNGMEAANNAIASGGKPEDADNAFVDAVFSKQGLEGYLQGVIGSGAIGGLGKISKYLITPNAKNSFNTEVANINMLEMELQKPEITPEAKAVIEQQRDQAVSRIADIIDVDQAQEEKIPEANREEVNQLSTQIEELNTAIQDPNVSKEVKAQVEEQIKPLREQLDSKLTEELVAKTTIKSPSEVVVGDTVELVDGRKGTVESVNDTQVILALEAGGKLTASPTMVEMSKVEPIVQNDGVIDVSQPQEEAIPQETAPEPEIIVETPIATPTQEKLTEIQTRRAEISQRLRSKLSNLNSGINPDALLDLVELGGTYIEEGVVRFKDFAERLQADLGKQLEDKDLREIYAKSAEAMGMGVRGFTERVRTNEDVPEATRTALDTTEQLYQRQDYSEIRSRLDQMDDAEKQRMVGGLEALTSQLTAEQNVGVLAGIDLINKYNAEGRTDEASKIVESLSKSATVAAQTLRQYGEFKNSTPDGYIQLVEKWLEKSNKKLTEAQKERIRELYAEQQAMSARADATLESLTQDLNDDNFKEYYAANIAFEDSIRNLEDYIDNIRGKNLFDTLAKILQGNLLSIKSVTINPFANFVQLGVRVAENDAATAVDALVGLITSRRTKSATLTADNIKLGGRAIKEGISRANRKAFRGTANSELAKYDVGGRLKPAVAFKRLFDNLRSSSNRADNQYGWEQGLSDFAESTFGAPANLMFRMLPYGDDPFFEQAKTQRLVEIGKRDKGLEGEALEKFVLKPDEKSREDAETYGREATFQEANAISTTINRLINDGAKKVESIGGRQASSIYRFIMKGILPFVNTPSSIALKTVKFAVPAIPFAQGMNDLVQLRKALKMRDSSLKETRIRKAQKDFSEHMGEAVISAAVLSAAFVIVANGLATGDLPEDQFQKKQKDFMFATQPPNTLNIDGLQRLLAGGDPTYQQGDKAISYVPLGLIGAQIGIVNATQGAALREKKKTANVVTTSGLAYYPDTDANPVNFLGNFLTNAPAAVRYFFNQSFVQGAETVLSAVSKENGAKNLLPQLGKTFVSIGIPNTVSQAFRASNDYMRDLYTDDQVQTFANVIAEKVGKVEDLPIKYDLWGKPIKQTPDGSNPYVYQILDIFRSQKILQDPITFAIFDIQRKTGDDAAIPPAVDDSFTKQDIRIKLSKAQKSELTKVIGEERRKLAERVLATYDPQKSDPERYIERLKRVYVSGAKKGTYIFKRKEGIK